MSMEDDDWEGDDDSVDDDQYTSPCPHCNRMIYEDAQRCPHRIRLLTDRSVRDGDQARLD